eukprot:TRINITY_DN21645_c0_g1_i1.p1 TRINITY_DN21645_c0_g1~~TRINITY_DN21645_c0_g1_i1.p1  ORF type:complete len:158 (+),score=6.66 TRINITY_DN21645_c0_g1_i1:60-476(+)
MGATCCARVRSVNDKNADLLLHSEEQDVRLAEGAAATRHAGSWRARRTAKALDTHQVRGSRRGENRSPSRLSVDDGEGPLVAAPASSGLLRSTRSREEDRHIVGRSAGSRSRANSGMRSPRPSNGSSSAAKLEETYQF